MEFKGRPKCIVFLLMNHKAEWSTDYPRATQHSTMRGPVRH